MMSPTSLSFELICDWSVRRAVVSAFIVSSLTFPAFAGIVAHNPYNITSGAAVQRKIAFDISMPPLAGAIVWLDRGGISQACDTSWIVTLSGERFCQEFLEVQQFAY